MNSHVNGHPITVKIWGHEELIVNDPAHGYCGKILHIDPHFWCSLHYHPRKAETFLVVDGVVTVEYFPRAAVVERTVVDAGPKVTYTMFEGESLTLPPFTPHRFRVAKGHDWGAKIVEFSTPHSDRDVVRLVESGPVDDDALKFD